MNKKSIKNRKDGMHFNSKFWQAFKAKKRLTLLQKNILVGMILGDATMAKESKNPYLKFEQGFKQKEFLFKLFKIFQNFTFMEKPAIRYEKSSTLRKKNFNDSRNVHEKCRIKSFWFKTFSHPEFTTFYDAFYRIIKDNNSKKRVEKVVNKVFLKKYFSLISFGFWIMCDGSLSKDKKTLFLHTQGFDLESQRILQNLLKDKWNLDVSIVEHKKIYWVLKISNNDINGEFFKRIDLRFYIHPSLWYKIPQY